jgi:hypothetical protein
MKKFQAIVNGEQAYVEVPDKKNPEKKIQVPVGSKENFIFEAENTEQALIIARREIVGRKIKERKFKGVIEIKEKVKKKV